MSWLRLGALLAVYVAGMAVVVWRVRLSEASYLDKGWLAARGNGDHVHVTPVDDLIEHDVTDDGDCVCGPEVEPIPRDDGSFGWSIVHHPLDSRGPRAPR